MGLSRKAIKLAFHKHGLVYHNQKGWDIPYHLYCWEQANLAFEGGSFADFEWLYDELKRRWQAFRSARSRPWSARRTYNRLRELGDKWRHVTLRSVTDDDVPECWGILRSMVGLKPLKYGPSVVAISKVLHLWNPRLFVIVDNAAMWKRVFSQRRFKEPMLQTRHRVASLVNDADETVSYGACDLLSYIAILRWSADLVRCNPTITECFANHVGRHADDRPTGLPLESYDGAAVEWLLLGLAEMPGARVDLAVR